MRLIEDHEMSEEILIEVLGWSWLSFLGTPAKDTEGYPKKCRVRQFFSPEQLRSLKWDEFFNANNAQPARGDEPLSYRNCSSSGPAIPPKIRLLIGD